MTTRRNFLKSSGATLGTIALLGGVPLSLSACGEERSLSFGFQTWPLRDQLGKDLQGTLKMMATKGYKEVEFCSPFGYSGTPFEMFNSMSGKELKGIIKDSGLTCVSSHFNFGELHDNLDNRIEWAIEMGINQVILSSFGIPKGSIDEYKENCHELNKIGRKIKDAGLQCGFHNHNMEFEKRDKHLIYDVLMEELDPDLVKMQFQVAVISIGYNAADYFRKYPGRFFSAHLADWSSELNKQVPIGQGIIDWKDFFTAAKIGGVKNFYVEMAPDTYDESADFLKTIKI